jgi:hypothetical protein
MLTFPLNQDANLVVIEPGNIKRLKEGRALKVGEHVICFTPDMQAFVKALGVKDLTVADFGPGMSATREGLRISVEQLDQALKDCISLPEIDR